MNKSLSYRWVVLNGQDVFDWLALGPHGHEQGHHDLN